MWRRPLYESYGDPRIPCLDLRVKQDERRRSWSFEIFERDVAAEAGPSAMRGLDQLQQAPLDDWLAQLAKILDSYFSSLEASND